MKGSGSQRRDGAWRRCAARLAALTALAAQLIGCGVEEGLYPANRPPETYLSVIGDSLRTTHYRTILSWWGSDPDGAVIGYALRWSEPWKPASADSLWWEDSSWIFTGAMTDTFDVPIGGDFAARTFTVRAIDNELLADPQPATQVYPLENEPPIIAWTDSSRHPTREVPSLPAVSFAWTPEDYDGRRTIAYTRLWLDAAPGEDSATASITITGADTVGAFFGEHFQGRYGERTVYAQTFDAAATGSNIISWTWNVVAPAGEYLLIDNAWPANTSAADKQDRFWRAQMDDLVPGNYHIYDVDVAGTFRSSQEVLPLLSLFKGVLWYGIKYFSNEGANSDDVDRVLREGLELAEGSLVDYAAGGGVLLITGHNLIGSGGGLSAGFWQDEFGIAELYRHWFNDEWTTNLDLPKYAYVRCNDRFGGADSLRVARTVRSSEFFLPSPELEGLLWLEPATLDTLSVPEHATQPAYMAAWAQYGAGSITLCTTMLTDFHGSSNPEEAVANMLANIFGLR